jgi:hypothetical protein
MTEARRYAGIGMIAAATPVAVVVAFASTGVAVVAFAALIGLGYLTLPKGDY